MKVGQRRGFFLRPLPAVRFLEELYFDPVNDAVLPKLFRLALLLRLLPRLFLLPPLLLLLPLDTVRVDVGEQIPLVDGIANFLFLFFRIFLAAALLP